MELFLQPGSCIPPWIAAAKVNFGLSGMPRYDSGRHDDVF